MELKDIWGNDQAKRATEIAEAGKHSIKYIGNSEAELFRRYCQERGTAAYAFKPCPCGNTGDKEKPCVCSPTDIRWHRQQMSATPTDLAVTTWRYRLSALNFNQVKLPCKLDQQTREWLVSVSQQMKLGQPEILGVLKVAQAIARLGGYAQVKAGHLAEALQYHPGA
jgi:predicted ATPase with chaperone activity